MIQFFFFKEGCINHVAHSDVTKGMDTQCGTITPVRCRCLSKCLFTELL